MKFEPICEVCVVGVDSIDGTKFKVKSFGRWKVVGSERLEQLQAVLNELGERRQESKEE